MLSKLWTLFHTVRHLKPTQVFHQLKYRLVRPGILHAYGQEKRSLKPSKLNFSLPPPVYPSWDGYSAFEFLNLNHDFQRKIDWNFQDHGKLWNYNLQYANYLLQEGISDKKKADLMASLYAWLSDGRLPLEPYPVSLRAINMMRWASNNNLLNQRLEGCLFAELDFLSRRLEYHLLGNHLLENAFALMMGGAFFSQDMWQSKAKKILQRELDEQILEDGAHFELSPMYHQIIFFRLLELIDWYSYRSEKKDIFEQFLRMKASDMYAWLENISFASGDIPHFNDSTNGIAYSTEWILEYADKLGIASSKKKLGASGYRSGVQNSHEIKIDFAQIGPSYQPGHAHADALSFVLYYKGAPLFVEQGTSKYQIGSRRNLERSTEAHNTVVVNNTNQSDVWGGFRVARRAKTTIIAENEVFWEAKHDGYRNLGIEHKRSFLIDDSLLVIQDHLSKIGDAVCYYHLHPSSGIKNLEDGMVLLENDVKILFEGYGRVFVEDYEYAERYNMYATAKRICIAFKQTLKTTIHFE